MGEKIVGFSPHTGHCGSRRRLSSRNFTLSASKWRRRPTSGSPMPKISFNVSIACSIPIIPGKTPSTPACAQFGTESGGGGSGKGSGSMARPDEGRTRLSVPQTGILSRTHSACARKHRRRLTNIASENYPIRQQLRCTWRQVEMRFHWRNGTCAIRSRSAD